MISQRLKRQLQEKIRSRYRAIIEEAPAPIANNAGEANIDGIGVGPEGEPGVSKKCADEANKRDKEVGMFLRRANPL